MAMVFLTLFATLTIAMFELSSVNVQSAHSQSDAAHAGAVAETGVRWITYRFNHMNRPKTKIGLIDAATANSLWPAIASAITTDFSTLVNPSERTITSSGNTLTSNAIAVDHSNARFSLRIQHHPLGVGHPLHHRSD